MSDAVALLSAVCTQASADELRRVAGDWEVFEHRQGGELSGVAILRGTEFHCQLLQGFKLRRSEMREFLRPMFDRHGFLTTRVRHEDTANQRFNRAFGFERTWSDDRFHYFILSKLPFGREGVCQ